MRSYLKVLLLTGALAISVSGLAQNLFVLKKSEPASDSVFSVVIPAPNTGAVCQNLDSIRREISGDREVFLEWRRNRGQGWFLVDIDENGVPSRFRADGPATDIHAWMQQYLGAMRFRPAWSQTANPGNSPATRASTLRFCLPGFHWAMFEQEYYLASLVEGRVNREKGGECVEGYVRLRVLLDAKGQVLAHELLAGKNDYLNQVVAEELYKVGFKPAAPVAGAEPGVSAIPATSWSFLDFEFSDRSCR